MKIIRGSASEAICYAKEIPPEVEDNLKRICDHEFTKDHKIRVMPDATANAEGTITGFTMDYTDYIIMGLEYGAGCGMCLVDIGTGPVDLEKLDEICHEFPTQPGEILLSPTYDFDISGFRFEGAKRALISLPFSFGALGDGNHFIEVDADEDGRKYLLVHNGIEGVSSTVLKYYTNLALKSTGYTYIDRDKYDLDDTFLTGSDMEDYLNDSDLCVQLSRRNRRFIAESIIEAMGVEAGEMLDICHHYVDRDDHIIRHGAISAHQGEKVVIPINSRDGTILGVGKGNPDWNYSAPHGAGRLMSRTKARQTLTFEQYQRSVQKIFSTSVCEENLDEAPDAYRCIEDIAGQIRDSVEITKILKPIYNFKGV